MLKCEFENGKIANLRHTTVDAIALDDQGRVLLTKRAKHLIGGGQWCMPGGFLDRDETVFDGARRELLEETGYEVLSLDFFAFVSDPNRGDDRQNCTVVFVGKVGPQVCEPDNESTEIGWFDLEHLPSPMAFDHGRILEMYVEHRYGRNRGPVIY